MVVNQEGVGGGVRRWSPYEDEWVHQTQGMTIHSPALSEGDHLSNRSAEGSEELDEDSRGDVQMVSRGRLGFCILKLIVCLSSFPYY